MLALCQFFNNIIIIRRRRRRTTTTMIPTTTNQHCECDGPGHVYLGLFRKKREAWLLCYRDSDGDIQFPWKSLVYSSSSTSWRRVMTTNRQTRVSIVSERASYCLVLCPTSVSRDSWRLIGQQDVLQRQRIHSGILPFCRQHWPLTSCVRS